MYLLLVGIAVFEFVCWTLDPFDVHLALNDGKPQSLFGRSTVAFVNCVPLLACIYFLRSRMLGPLSCILPLVGCFTVNQFIFWWFPYFLGRLSGTVDMIEEHKQQLIHLPRILPKIKDHLVPDIEHTILVAFSVPMLFLLCRTYILLSPSKFNSQLLSFSSVFFGLIPLAFVATSSHPCQEFGPILASVCQLIIMFTTSKLSQKYQRVKRDE